MYLFTADSSKIYVVEQIDSNVIERLRFCMGNSTKIVRRLIAEYPQVNTDIGRALIGNMSCKIITYVDEILTNKYKCCTGGTSLLICASLLATLENTEIRYVSTDFSTIVNSKMQAVTSLNEACYSLTFIDLNEVSYVNRFNLLFSKSKVDIDVSRRIELQGYIDLLNKVADNNSNSDFVRYYLVNEVNSMHTTILGIKNNGLLYNIVKDVTEPASMNDYNIVYAKDSL